MAATNGARAHHDPIMAGADLLRVATAGSVDDGKSTLIGRLFFDSKLILEDQLEHLRKTSERRGDEMLNLALLTDGLRAEREQGITIDVAYRYFATPRRKFILADTPGHVQYTRNMVTGASTADLALILIDAQKGVLQQSRRHAIIASLLRVPHILVCINKMDLVDFDQTVYERIREEFTTFAAKLDVPDVAFIPVSALYGDNVVTRSERMPWYAGGSLLNHLETLFIASDRNLVDCRFPVQMVIQPTSATAGGYRGYAGQVVGGVFKPGDEVVVLPTDLTTTITAIDTFDGPLDEAFPPQAVTLRLADDIDLSRGDMICRENNRPQIGQRIDAMVCWMTERPLTTGGRYVLKHTTRTVNAHVAEVQYRLDIDSLHRDDSIDGLGLNDIGRLSLRLTAPIFYDDYRRNRATGAFILIEESSNVTVGAGMILGPTTA
jgi:bifunctional enzyme CysN/CysC